MQPDIEMKSSQDGIRAIAFDCYGTLIDFTDVAFKQTYHEICEQQSLACDGLALWEKWMEIWRRMASQGRARENPRNWPSARVPFNNRTLQFRPYAEEWPEHFANCFQELGVVGDPTSAYAHVRDRLAGAPTFDETAPVLGALKERYRIGILSNADDDFLYDCLRRNALQDEFELIVTSEAAGVYKPHEAIFQSYLDASGLEAHEVLYVGDSQFADVLGGRKAGMRVAWVNRDGAKLHDDVPAPDYVVASLSELLDVLQ